MYSKIDPSQLDSNFGPGSKDDIRVGHVITIKAAVGKSAKRQADHVEFDDLVNWLVQKFDELAREAIVIMQVISNDEKTAAHASAVSSGRADAHDASSPGVKGLLKADGSILAKRIQLESENEDEEVVANVTNLDSQLQRFELGGLVIDYRNPESVQSKGHSERASTASRVTKKSAEQKLIAKHVELGPADNSSDDYSIEIEGQITRFASSKDFDVDGQPIVFSDSTEVIVSDMIGLGSGTAVCVSGTFDAANRLVADNITIRPAQRSVSASSAKVSAQPARSRLKRRGPNKAGLVSRVVENSEESLSEQGAASIDIGDYTALYGYVSPAGSSKVAAVLLEMEETDSTNAQQSLTTALTGTTLDILSIHVETKNPVKSDCRGHGATSAAAFFAPMTQHSQCG